MEIPSRWQRSRIACDTLAICVGVFALSAFMASLSKGPPEFFRGLIAISFACGAVVGLGFGWTESPQVRRILGIPVFAMCGLHLVVQGRLFALGVYDEVTTSMSIWSFVSGALLLCWLADRRISRHLQPSFNLRLKYRFLRVLSGLGIGVLLLALIVGCYKLTQLDDPPKQILTMLYMAWHASNLCVGVVAFRALTCPTRRKQTLVNLTVIKVLWTGLVCYLIACVGFAIQGGQPTLPVAVSMVVLAAIVVTVLMRREFNPDKLLVFELASGGHQESPAD